MQTTQTPPSKTALPLWITAACGVLIVAFLAWEVAIATWLNQSRITAAGEAERQRLEEIRSNGIIEVQDYEIHIAVSEAVKKAKTEDNPYSLFR